MVVRWMTAARPWFHIVDRNGDGRLSSKEIHLATHSLGKLDANGDTVITSDEIPLLVRIEIRRTDDRLNRLDVIGNGTVESVPADPDWFSAMDTNRDGLIDRLEFIGEIEDFASLDENNDGFLSRPEVY